LKDAAAKEQKKMITIKNEVTKQEEKKEKAKELADKQAIEEADKVNVVELEPTEKVELYNKIKKVTFVRPSTDPVKNIELKKEALKRANDLQNEVTNEMYLKKREMDLYKQRANATWRKRLERL
jgi:hypothetical protein